MVQREQLIMPAGGSRNPTSHETVSGGGHFIKINGHEVFRFATPQVLKATDAVACKAGWAMADLDPIIPHQANTRIIESATKRLTGHGRFRRRPRRPPQSWQRYGFCR